jgi:hypothetical protein
MNRTANMMALSIAIAGTMLSQTLVPDGTPVKLRLNEGLNSGRNRVGQGVSLSVAEDVLVGDKVVIESGARATGTITVAEPRRHLGRGGKLDFAPEKIQLPDGRMIAVRATPQGNEGKGKGVTTGIVAAGIALVFWPAAPLALLIKGKDIDMPVGMTFTSFTDAKFTTRDGVSGPASVAPSARSEADTRTVAVSITSDTEASEIEIDGSFVGQVPANLNLSPGEHRVAVRHENLVWERTVRLTSGNAVNLRAILQSTDTRLAARIQP